MLWLPLSLSLSVPLNSVFLFYWVPGQLFKNHSWASIKQLFHFYVSSYHNLKTIILLFSVNSVFMYIWADCWGCKKCFYHVTFSTLWITVSFDVILTDLVIPTKRICLSQLWYFLIKVHETWLQWMLNVLKDNYDYWKACQLCRFSPLGTFLFFLHFPYSILLYWKWRYFQLSVRTPHYLSLFLPIIMESSQWYFQC